MPKFRIGDKVKFHPERIPVGNVPDLWSHLVDTSKVYTVTFVGDGGSTFMIDDGHGFTYYSTWLEKVDDSKFRIKVKAGRIKDVKFSGPATIVFWTDGTKTVVKCRKGDKFDPEKGIAMACAKKLLGNEDGYHKQIVKHIESADAKTLREEAYRLCGRVRCETCPSKGLFGECPNFLRLGASDLKKFVHAMRGAKKYGDS